MVLKKKAKKTASRKASKPKEKVIGSAEHYFDKLHVVTTTLKRPLKVGDIIHIKGHTTDMVQTVESIQIEHSRVLKAKKGDGVGIKVYGPVRDTDIIYFADKKSGISTESADKVVLNFQKMRDEMQKEPQQKRPSAAAFNPILPKQAMPSVKPLRKQENPGTSSGTKFFNF